MHNIDSKYNLKRFIEITVVPDLVSLGFYNDHLNYFRKTNDITQLLVIVLSQTGDEFEVKYGLHSDEIVMNSFEDFCGFLTPKINSCFWGSTLGAYKLDQKEFDTNVIEPFLIKFRNEVLPIFKNVFSLKDAFELCERYPDRFISSLYKPVYYLTIGDRLRGVNLFRNLVSEIREKDQKALQSQNNVNDKTKTAESIARQIEWHESSFKVIAQRFRINI